MSPPPSSPSSLFSLPEIIPATRTTPPIPGLYIFPSLLSSEIAQTALAQIANDDIFIGGTRNQVMIFSRPGCIESLPSYILELLNHLDNLLRPLLLVEATETVLDQPLGRQAILNLYLPGQGISPHIDLPSRYADGILGVSLTGGSVMTFTPTEERMKDKTEHHVYLPPRSVYVLTGEARWEWLHGIIGRTEDLVEGENQRDETILRDVRVSVTFRWMKEGGQILYSIVTLKVDTHDGSVSLRGVGEPVDMIYPLWRSLNLKPLLFSSVTHLTIDFHKFHYRNCPSSLPVLPNLQELVLKPACMGAGVILCHAGASCRLIQHLQPHRLIIDGLRSTFEPLPHGLQYHDKPWAEAREVVLVLRAGSGGRPESQWSRIWSKNLEKLVIVYTTEYWMAHWKMGRRPKHVERARSSLCWKLARIRREIPMTCQMVVVGAGHASARAKVLDPRGEEEVQVQLSTNVHEMLRNSASSVDDLEEWGQGMKFLLVAEAEEGWRMQA
ncbi:hypothetical protein M231_05231 [Tremella mesenterica]|uniref:Fe2OG dioxygenase domain-containing protein n=1 Tax=Tremella mesenterica TaxID=5217 RepID=A0A4Q1BIP8_TREME|nr:hypothetical protein M231_05231 [Tremella mesenterica]